jgi:phosphatidylserine/phosphatidylglycerophosphate/cardiolipin synthase-like enzyme
MKKNIAVLLLCFFSFLASPLASAGWYSVYFTEPEKNNKSVKVSAPEDALISMLNSAKVSIDAAFFEVGSERVAAAFIAAHKRKVVVRLVSDERSRSEKAYKKIVSAGISVVCDDKNGFMHNKFCVIDGKYLWTGSYNITDNCAYRNNNNAICMASPELSAIYDEEFKEMFERRIFQNKKESRPLSFTGNPYYVKIGNTNINAYFSPDNDVEDLIVKRIKKAKKSIYFMAFSFTSDPIGEAMIEGFKKGVKIEGLFEKNGSESKDSEYKKFLVEKIPVKTDRNKHNMHHKVIIIDEELVITGSYNFSKNASKRNDENILMIEDAEIAKKYIAEFRKLY